MAFKTKCIVIVNTFENTEKFLCSLDKDGNISKLIFTCEQAEQLVDILNFNSVDFVKYKVVNYSYIL